MGNLQFICNDLLKGDNELTTLPLTEHTPMAIQLCLSSRTRLCGNNYYSLFSSNVGLTNIVVQSMGQSGVETKYGMPTWQGQ